MNDKIEKKKFSKPHTYKHTITHRSQFYDSALFRAIKNKRRDNLKVAGNVLVHG